VELRQYEVMLILLPDAEEPVVVGVIDRITQVLADRGEVGKVDRWGRRRLTHQIEHQTDGYYVVLDLKADPDVVSELDRSLQLADDVLRFKVIVKGKAA